MLFLSGRILPFVLLLFVFVYCGRSLKDKLVDLQTKEKYEEMLLLCLSEKETPDAKELCDFATEKTAAGIDRILSEKTELPFSQITVDSEWKQKIDKILQNNETLRNRYGNLWKKLIQND
ncbi:hypothetical protein LFX25_08120 [Leptospira sp. FAT2]|nr:hypothetical protein [Leptospira sanjuanensis]MCG6167789.1 hypothetical protein [Leptospira sanjuanensis]MCG6193206.1 hypothetical protein [Leptospira sanjuanensis]